MRASHMIVSFLIFAMLVSLILTGYNGIVKSYVLTPTDLDIDGNNVMDRLNNIAIIDAVKVITTAFQKVTDPASSQFDIVGGLLSIGLGALYSIVGLIALPAQIIGVLVGYNIPPAIAMFLPIIISIYIYMALIRKQTGGN